MVYTHTIGLAQQNSSARPVLAATRPRSLTDGAGVKVAAGYGGGSSKGGAQTGSTGTGSNGQFLQSFESTGVFKRTGNVNRDPQKRSSVASVMRHIPDNVPITLISSSTKGGRTGLPATKSEKLHGGDWQKPQKDPLPPPAPVQRTVDGSVVIGRVGGTSALEHAPWRELRKAQSMPWLALEKEKGPKVITGGSVDAKPANVRGQNSRAAEILPAEFPDLGKFGFPRSLSAPNPVHKTAGHSLEEVNNDDGAKWMRTAPQPQRDPTRRASGQVLGRTMDLPMVGGAATVQPVQTVASTCGRVSSVSLETLLEKSAGEKEPPLPSTSTRDAPSPTAAKGTSAMLARLGVTVDKDAIARRRRRPTRRGSQDETEQVDVSDMDTRPQYPVGLSRSRSFHGGAMSRDNVSGRVTAVHLSSEQPSETSSPTVGPRAAVWQKTHLRSKSLHDVVLASPTTPIHEEEEDFTDANMEIGEMRAWGSLSSRPRRPRPTAASLFRQRSGSQTEPSKRGGVDMFTDINIHGDSDSQAESKHGGNGPCEAVIRGATRLSTSVTGTIRRSASMRVRPSAPMVSAHRTSSTSATSTTTKMSSQSATVGPTPEEAKSLQAASEGRLLQGVIRLLDAYVSNPNYGDNQSRQALARIANMLEEEEPQGVADSC
eukprot:comp24210_c0_seq1/m.44478 comp24210_c0_seq1/g.44478  ORF comp24210_c0_seq1/g.44478 comp24210_c0_seq1/m.44478 type:complete len:656 (-) comp24210_c0_seq1:31-1998(-)